LILSNLASKIPFSIEEKEFIKEEKMRKIKILVLMSSLFMAMSGLGLAQQSDSHIVTMQVLDIALLRIIPGDITLTIGPPAIPGMPPGDATDSTCRVQYTALVPSGMSRIITVAWAVGDVAPAGTTLRVTATPANLGGGNEGASAGSVDISSSPTNVVTGIGSCYTGIGAAEGAQLAYVLAVTTPASLVSGETRQATVTYTLTDAA